MVRVRLLGGFEVTVGDRPADEGAWRLRKARTLVKMLALAPGHRLHREQVTELLWPGRPPAAAANNLHQALHAARRRLGDADRLRLEDDVLVLCGGGRSPWIDAEAFRAEAAAALRAGDPERARRALALYGGQLLPEDLYEDWTEPARGELEHLREELGRLADGGPARGARDNLPADATRFMSRAAALGEVAGLLARGPLLTLTGAAGSGKTRLALEVAARARDRHTDGVWLVELAALSEPELVPDAIAGAAGLKLGGRTLADALAGSETLLVLDSCEHLVEPLAALAGTLLRRCPGVTVLVTSRKALRIPGEVVWRVPSMEAREAARLFADRAAAADPGSAVTAGNGAHGARRPRPAWRGRPTGSFGAEAAAAICGDEDDALLRLVRKSLVAAGEAGGRPRVRLLEMVLGAPLPERISVMPYALRQRLQDPGAPVSLHNHWRSDHLAAVDDRVVDVLVDRATPTAPRRSWPPAPRCGGTGRGPRAARRVGPRPLGRAAAPRGGDLRELPRRRGRRARPGRLRSREARPARRRQARPRPREPLPHQPQHRAHVMDPILVTGATGTIGTHVVRDLRERGLPVRPFCRTAGDLGDPVAVRAAVAGASQVFLCTANGPQQLEHELAVIDAAAAAGVRRIVKISTVGAEPGSPAPFWDVHGRSERHLAAVGVPAVVLRACFLMKNIDPAAPALVAPAAGARIAMVDPADVAACAAAALAGDAQGRFLLTGPEALTFPEVADVLGVEFVPVPDEAAREAMTAAGMPPWLADGIVAIFGRLRQGAGEEVTGDVRRLLGRDPRSFAEYAASLAPLTPAGG